jgi:hypothetical protein
MKLVRDEAQEKKPLIKNLTKFSCDVVVSQDGTGLSVEPLVAIIGHPVEDTELDRMQTTLMLSDEDFLLFHNCRAAHNVEDLMSMLECILPAKFGDTMTTKVFFELLENTAAENSEAGRAVIDAVRSFVPSVFVAATNRSTARCSKMQTAARPFAKCNRRR